MRPAHGAGVSKPFVRNLENGLGVSTALLSPNPSKSGEVWAGPFWSMRAILGQAKADRLLAAAWIGAD
jgi:hypothetical protein